MKRDPLYLENVYLIYVDRDIADEETQKWVADEIKRQGKEEVIELIYFRSSEGPAPEPKSADVFPSYVSEWTWRND